MEEGTGESSFERLPKLLHKLEIRNTKLETISNAQNLKNETVLFRPFPIRDSNLFRISKFELVGIASTSRDRRRRIIQLRTQRHWFTTTAEIERVELLLQMRPGEIDQHSGKIHSDTKGDHTEANQKDARYHDEQGTEHDLLPGEGNEPFHETEIKRLGKVLR